MTAIPCSRATRSVIHALRPVSPCALGHGAGAPPVHARVGRVVDADVPALLEPREQLLEAVLRELLAALVRRRVLVREERGRVVDLRAARGGALTCACAPQLPDVEHLPRLSSARKPEEAGGGVL
jgi:hypothetical protein